MLIAFVVWSVLGPMLLLQRVRLPMFTLVFIYGGNLVYVNISLFYMLRNIVNSNPHPAFAFVLNDLLLECLSVSLCLLLLLAVSQITMQVSIFASFICAS